MGTGALSCAEHATVVVVATRYLSRTELAERIGVKPDTLGRYNLPEPDALIGKTRGWLPATVDRWHAERPGRGRAYSDE
ncbi:hypothetical protein BRW64_00870 [Mycolicibacterium diernhoferi]|uniref:Uncharacterized protein n=1 Tax=Mycolicibacterium diernhoferi TaxID=1801 RepID=A0A1Q4HKW8_9MYCO|nr:hypothetical protein BRW64_00870 [Mycolicibacterium diernhoferi]OPE55753.1 hypothetical protein BV510_03410 [Mycolicibacterium diernhoferi]